VPSISGKLTVRRTFDESTAGCWAICWDGVPLQITVIDLGRWGHASSEGAGDHGWALIANDPAAARLLGRHRLLHAAFPSRRHALAALDVAVDLDGGDGWLPEPVAIERHPDGWAFDCPGAPFDGPGLLRRDKAGWMIEIAGGAWGPYRNLITARRSAASLWSPDEDPDG